MTTETNTVKREEGEMDGWILTKDMLPDTSVSCEVTFADRSTGWATYLSGNGRWYKVAITEPAQVVAWRKRLPPYTEEPAG